ncbi:MAG: hypothetical protein JW965_02145 [Bacteroidales bacterium]|nr:hypothetical protein [Bacteroidales bacterium]
MKKGKLIISILLIVMLNCCSTIKAPIGSVPNRKALTTDAYGGWLEMTINSSNDSITGEFIAANEDSIYIMQNGEIQIYAISNISFARVIIFNNARGAYLIWTVAGSLLTISNGGFFIFTLPTVLVSGILTTVAESKRVNYLDYPSNGFKELSKYARFPQGMPEGIKASDLNPRLTPKR